MVAGPALLAKPGHSGSVRLHPCRTPELKVVISWSGARSRAIAEALRDWLPDVMQGIEPWMSAADIEAGARWADDLSEELQGTHFGVICLTSENLSAPWILFEAGALSKAIEKARVCTYLLHLSKSQITGPLVQFQANSADEKGTEAIVRSLNKQRGPDALTPERLTKAFSRFWPDLKRALDAVPQVRDEASAVRPDRELLEELLAIVRDMARGRRTPAISFNPRSSPNIDILSGRELDVFCLIGQGLTTRQIAAHLRLSPKTIETYRESIRSKFGIPPGPALTRLAVRHVLTNEESGLSGSQYSRTDEVSSRPQSDVTSDASATEP